jgi:hypothetical protein
LGCEACYFVTCNAARKVTLEKKDHNFFLSDNRSVLFRNDNKPVIKLFDARGISRSLEPTGQIVVLRDSKEIEADYGW